ncbi:unnamed protein product [Caenorhabditis angaria]|uniref:Seven TM Receptor n=1 Tax=Caenorhabditis angaria TaxID=860376 RepID=A0A9P1N902_9PELO|nr:unnamed protein product [Caenorhabditis angaria]
MFDWLVTAQLVAFAGFVSTVIFDTVLIVLTLFIKRTLGYYKYLIITFALLGMCFSAIDYYLHPILHSHNDGFIFFSSENNFNRNVRDILIALYPAFYSSTVSMLTIQYIYRYWAIFHVHRLRYFKNWRLVFWLVYVVIISMEHTFAMTYFAKFDNYSISYMSNTIMDFYNKNILDLSGIAVVVYDVNGNFRWKNVFYVINASLSTFSQYCIMIYTGTVMNKKMDNVIHVFSPQLQRVNRQIFKTLVVQMVFPTILLFVPVFITYLVPFFRLKIDIPSGIFTCSLGIYPAIDSLFLFLFVSEYKNVFKKFGKKPKQRIFSNVG